MPTPPAVPPVGFHKTWWGGHYLDSPEPPPPIPPAPSTPPPEPPAFPPPTPPPGNPGTLHFGRLLIPILVLAALTYFLPMLVPHEKKPDGLADLKLLDTDAVLSDATRTFTSFATSTLPSSDLANVEKLQTMAEDAPMTARTILAASPSSPTALLNASTLKAFAYSLYTPLNSELWNSEDGVKATAERVASGFALANALGFWLEVLGYYVGFVYGTISTLGLFDHMVSALLRTAAGLPHSSLSRTAASPALQASRAYHTLTAQSSLSARASSRAALLASSPPRLLASSPPRLLLSSSPPPIMCTTMLIERPARLSSRAQYLGSGIGLFCGMLLELCLAVAVAYLLYWSVRGSADTGYQLVAACVYCLFAVANLLYALMCLWGGFEPIRFVAYLLKVAAATGCAYYTIKIRARAMGVDLSAEFAAGEASPRDKEDYVVVTNMHQPPPPFPGKAAAPPTELV